MRLEVLNKVIWKIRVWVYCATFLCQVVLFAWGQPVWLAQIETDVDFDGITVTDQSRPDLLRTGKFTAPAKSDPALLHTVYQNVNRFPLHQEFLAIEFPERFAGLTEQEYLDLVYWRSSRQYFAGSISRFQDSQGEILYGFDIYSDLSEPPLPDEVLYVYQLLSQTMTLRPFAYAPKTVIAIETAREWQDPGFPIYLPDGFVIPDYEVYSPAANYGRVRIYTLSELQEAEDDGLIGWQDIVVVDSAPTDIETVVAGVITGTQQGELSHVNVRSLRRGTPNAYIRNATEVFAPYSGQLVKLTLAADGYEVVAPVDLADAEAWWISHRPVLSPLPDPDDTYSELVALPQLALVWDTEPLVRRFGGKATGLAKLYSFLDEAYQVDGFAIPFHYYTEFMNSNMIRDPEDPFRLITFQEYLNLLLNDTHFRTDTAYRREKLEHFQDVIRLMGVIDPALISGIVTKIQEVYGSTGVMVRFRSSSNSEDDIEFNGAGLYNSTSVCAEDTLDDDNTGPSHCYPDEGDERTIERGLNEVWASLWNPKAFEEREYYQIDHRKVRMGILVTRAFPSEDCNGVAFTGDPVTGRKNYFVINVQMGDYSVVLPGTGIVPEKDLLTYADGQVSEFLRARGSSLLPQGEWVLSEDQLREIGGVLWEIEEKMPIDLGEYRRDQVCLDIEFKYDKGKLVIKQVRPTLMVSTEQPEEENCILRIPQNTRVVGVFQEGRILEQEYEYLSSIDLVAGDHAMPLESGTYSFDLVNRFEFGPERRILQPLTPGILTVKMLGNPINRVEFRFDQDFDLDGQALSLFIDYLSVNLVDGKPNPETIVFDEPFLSQNLYMLGRIQVGVRIDFLRYASETYASLPLYKIDLALENGQSVHLYQRWQPAMAGTGPANLVYAQVDIEEGYVEQGSYWNLVYAADHHNWNEKFWVLLDTPIGETYGLAVLTGETDYDREVYTLDCNLQPLRYIGIEGFQKDITEHLPPVDVPEWYLH
ncbi:MAG TPA: PEP/pyruvate-binding domain-containing protein [bacterium]|nr:PEP/pyruvate-binding domain-containing protein [bacterium]